MTIAKKNRKRNNLAGRHGKLARLQHASAKQAGKKALIYARVSTKGQEREGFSIDAQVKFLREFAARNGYEVAEEFVEAESAWKVGRTVFGKMVGWLKRAHPKDRVVLVESVDRLSRNHADIDILDQHNTEVHFAREGVVASPESGANVQLVVGMKATFSRFYSAQLSESAKKGQREKASQGLWPSQAPLGYKNETLPNGRKVITVDPEIAPIISKMFEWYASGQYSVKEVAKMARREGLFYRKSGNRIPRDTIYRILQNPLYKGVVRWNGEEHQGRHKPLVSVDLWEQVQRVLEGRNRKKLKRRKHDFAYSRLISCSRCGCSVVGEIKHEKFIYYHPSGYKGKCHRDPKSCRGRNVREEKLEQQIGEILERLQFDPDVLGWLVRVLRSKQSNRLREHKQAIGRYRKQHTDLENKLRELLTVRCEGVIGNEEYKQRTSEWRDEQSRCRQEIEIRQKAMKTDDEEIARNVALAAKLPMVFKTLSPTAKRQILNILFESVKWDDGKLNASFRAHFDCMYRQDQRNPTGFFKDLENQRQRFSCCPSQMPGVLFPSANGGKEKVATGLEQHSHCLPTNGASEKNRRGESRQFADLQN